MDVISAVLWSLLAVVTSGLVARVSRQPIPLVQIAFGALLAWAGLGTAELEPAVFFLLFLPPLLFLDGWRLPKDALRRDVGSMLRLALGLVLVTVLCVGWFIHWLVPAMPLAVAFALAAALSPTDPVAVSSLATGTALPARLLHILQGEALLNDASGLVCMRYAVVAALTGLFSWTDAALTLAWLLAVGLSVGCGVTWLVARFVTWSTKRWGDDGISQILITLLLPFGVYLLAEELHGSGILAAAAAGVTMSQSESWPWRATTRLRRTAVWDMVRFAASGSVFVLLGQQLPGLMQSAPLAAMGAGHISVLKLLMDSLLITFALGLLRFTWMAGWTSLQWRSEEGVDAPVLPLASSVRWPQWPNWRLALVVSLAGARGAVTMAAVLSLPLLSVQRTPFPARDLAILLAAGVIVCSLVIASALLPMHLRKLARVPSAVKDKDSQLEDHARRSAALAAVRAVRAAAAAADAVSAASDVGTALALAERIAAPYLRRVKHLAEGPLGVQRQAREGLERRLQLVALRAERAEVLRHGRLEGVSELVLRRWVREIDLQESRQGG